MASKVWSGVVTALKVVIEVVVYAAPFALVSAFVHDSETRAAMLEGMGGEFAKQMGARVSAWWSAKNVRQGMLAEANT